MSASRGETGQVLVFVAVMLPLFVAIVGLAVDGGVVFNARRELQNVADSAARAGAMQIDQRAYRESAGQQVVLDTGSAREVAASYLEGQRSGLSAQVAANPDQVVVHATRDVPTSFLRLVGINTVRIGATAPAELRYGVERANR